jgi:hypothetical protein
MNTAARPSVKLLRGLTGNFHDGGCFMTEDQAIAPFTLRWKPLLAAGALSGLAQVAAGVIMYLAGFYFDPRSALVSLVVLSLCIVVGTTWYGRTVLGGSMTYWRALFIGMVIGVCTGLLYGIYNIVSITLVYPNFLENMVQAQMARLEASGMDEPQLQLQLASLQAQATVGRIAMTNFLGLSVLGAGVSALVAIGFRQKKVPGGGRSEPSEGGTRVR